MGEWTVSGWGMTACHWLLFSGFCRPHVPGRVLGPLLDFAYSCPEWILVSKPGWQGVPLVGGGGGDVVKF